jgi:predicted pyridoxine 5'-phosphate oxidase superfamily flavin-nucleotide-binding protein
MLSKLRNLVEGKVIAFATSDKNGKPNLVMVEGNKIIGNQILITDNQLNKTLRNLKQNKKAAIVCGSGDKWYQLKGNASYYSTGKWLEFVKSLPANKGYKPKGAVLVRIKELYSLNDGKRLA